MTGYTGPNSQRIYYRSHRSQTLSNEGREADPCVIYSRLGPKSVHQPNQPSRDPFLHLLNVTLVILLSANVAYAQAPVNDIVSWPSGLLLLATILYIALGTSPDDLWSMEPIVGLLTGTGLPLFSLPTMRKVRWVASACHFVPGIRSANGTSAFWIRTEDITSEARSSSLRKVLQCMRCVSVASPAFVIDETRWKVNEWGFLESHNVPSSLASPPLLHTKSVSPPSSMHVPTAHDFLLFAAIDYHVFREWNVHIVRKGDPIFSTEGSERSCIFDVCSEEDALPIVAAQMVRRPKSQSVLRQLASHDGEEDDPSPYILDLNSCSLDEPICCIDIHSYAPREHAVRASLRELAGAYYRVVRYFKESDAYSCPPDSVSHISVSHCLWIAILGGALLDRGRVTIQNLPGRWGNLDTSADEAYEERIESVLECISDYINTPAFDDIVFSGGIARGPAIPFLIAGLVGQILVCYFLAVGTSAGVWTSVALANSIFSGKLLDLHTLYFGKTGDTTEPGFKMRVPSSSSQLMIIATLNRTPPRVGGLRPGVLLNAFGLIGAIFGAVFQGQTRSALGFSPFQPCQPWVVYTTAALSIFIVSLELTMNFRQQRISRNWSDRSEFPARVATYSTVPTAMLAAVLTIILRWKGQTKFWPILDALTWVSGIPLGMLENGRIIPMDQNRLHLLLVLRWLMGAMASAVGSSDP
ncbi:hypothetical protein K474DRAFT_922770 [Panus rudis PR-1116 ss-1]|nr:hypothetical protein K474DRAFT_922770 [Panus rudis PR-1116 ss-1]